LYDAHLSRVGLAINPVLNPAHTAAARRSDPLADLAAELVIERTSLYRALGQ